MSAPRTPSQRGSANRRKGASAELAVAKYLRTVGFPQAERAVRTGYRTATRTSADPGDLTGVPGLAVSIKDCAVEQLRPWLAELDVMVAGSGAGLGILIHKRRGHADPGRWWCWLRLRDALALAYTGATGRYMGPSGDDPVRMELGHVVPLLRGAGYGDTAVDAEAVA